MLLDLLEKVEAEMLLERLAPEVGEDLARSILDATQGSEFLALLFDWLYNDLDQAERRTMIESHRHLAITEQEWEAFAGDFVASLNKFGVPDELQQALLAYVGTTHDDIVTA